MSKKEKKILRSFMMITQISITMLVPIFISGWLGTWLNRLFGTQIIFPFMLLLGIGAGLPHLGSDARYQKCIYINQVLL